jgi:hypothetical protein
MMLSLTWLTTSVGEGDNVTIDLKPFDAQRGKPAALAARKSE